MKCTVAKFHSARYNTSLDMNYFLPFRSSPDYRQTTDRQTESDVYEPTVQLAQVGSKIRSIYEDMANRAQSFPIRKLDTILNNHLFYSSLYYFFRPMVQIEDVFRWPRILDDDVFYHHSFPLHCFTHLQSTADDRWWKHFTISHWWTYGN